MSAEIGRVRHKYYVNLKKPDHLFVFAKNQSFCGRVKTKDIYTDDYWYLLDKLRDVFTEKKKAGNTLCGVCVIIHDKKSFFKKK